MQIIHVNLTQENPTPLTAGKSLELTYSVKWVETNVTFARRFDVYLDYPFFEHQVKWRSSIVSSEVNNKGIYIYIVIYLAYPSHAMLLAGIFLYTML